MTIIELKEKLEAIEKELWYEQMADFLNWRKYYQLIDERNALRTQINNFQVA